MALFRHHDPPAPTPIMEAAERLRQFAEDLQRGSEALLRQHSVDLRKAQQNPSWRANERRKP